MIAGIGIDLVTISRVERLKHRFQDRFETKVFTPEEVGQSGGRASYLAGRFAVKEALLKALGSGLTGGVRWQDIETLTQTSGSPEVRCYGTVRGILVSRQVSRVWTSITHEKDQVIALVVLEGEVM